MNRMRERKKERGEERRRKKVFFIDMILHFLYFRHMHAYYDDWIDIGGSVRINQLGRKFCLSVSIDEIIYKFALNKYTHTFTIMLREKKEGGRRKSLHAENVKNDMQRNIN